MKKLIVWMAGFALLALLTVNQEVAASSKDTSKPTLNSFSVNDSSITEGDTVKINYSVKDSGGSHLKQVELWKGNSKGNLGRVESQTDKPSSGKDSASGSFTDKPSAGTVYYGIHVVDNAGNVGYDSGAKSVTVKARDNAKPTVSLSVDRDTIAEGDTVTISYKVRDSGGTGLKKVELWKGASKDNLGPKQTDSASGDAKDGKFTDKPSSGTSYYGIHAIDGAGNVGYDNGAKSVTVKGRDSLKPTVFISVERDTISEGDTVKISYKVRDSGGTGLKKVELWKGASKDNLGPKQTDSASGNAKDGMFTDKPSAGTSYYGIHAIDGAGNVGYDNGALPVKVVAATQSPNVTGITVKPSSISAGHSAVFNATTDHAATKAVLRFTDANIEVPMSGSGTNWSANPQINNAGNRPFIVTAYDKNNKAGSSKNGTIQVIKQQDTTKPKVTNLDVSSQSVKLGNPVTISYTVKDDGGSGLKQVELWRGNDKNNLGPIKKETLSGQPSKSGAFNDTPSEAKTYYYGIHVLDKADNVGYDNGAAQVSVIAENNNPVTNGWQTDGETEVQKRIVAAALNGGNRPSPQSITGTWWSDTHNGDGGRIQSAIKDVYNYWDANGRQRLPLISLPLKVKQTMRSHLTTYNQADQNVLIEQIRCQFNGTVPSDDNQTLKYLAIRAQCKEFADRMVRSGGGTVSPYNKNAKVANTKIRPGMYAFKNDDSHSAIIVAVFWEKGQPSKIRLAESNYGRGWSNPLGQVPWQRTINTDRTPVLISDYYAVATQ